MSIQPGLYSRQDYDRFVGKWHETVLCEAKKWCRNDEAARLLAEAVLNDCRHRFATKKPPSEPVYYLRAQVCLVFSTTGQSIERIKNYILDHPFVEAVQDSEETAGSEAAAETDETPKCETAAAAKTDGMPNCETSAAVENEEAPLPDECADGEAAGDGEKPDEAARGKPDTFFDPVRTAMWSPEGGKNPHIIEEIVIEDDDADEEERSVGLSFFNSILFLMTAASFIFFCYETGAIQFLLR